METLPDGTPVTEIVEELKAAEAEILRLRRVLRQIGYYCNAKGWSRDHVNRRDAINRLVSRDALREPEAV